MPHTHSERAVQCDINIAFLIHKKLWVYIFKVIFILCGLLVPLDLEE